MRKESEIKEPSVANRKWLAQVLPEWEAQFGLPQDVSERLRERYELSNLQHEASNKFLMTVYAFGGLILAGGVISFVAAHWEGMSVVAKLVLLFGFMLGLHGTGFYLWQVTGRHERLGHALILIGTVVFAANIGLVAQIFHINEDWSRGYGVAALGALAMMFAVESIPIGVWALIMNFVFAAGRLDDPFSVSVFMIAQFLLYIPFALSKRSVILFGLTIISWLVFSALTTGHQSWGTFYSVTFTILLSAGLILTLDEVVVRLDFGGKFSGALVLLTGIAVLGLWYFIGFREVNLDLIRVFERAHLGDVYLRILLPALGGLVFVLGLIRWFLARKRGLRYPPVAVSLQLMIGLSVWMLFGLIHGGHDMAGVWLLNLLSLFTGGFLLIQGIRTYNRQYFWWGMTYSALVVISRFFEYTESLMMKALIFIVCGAFVMAATYQFERYLKRKNEVIA